MIACTLLFFIYSILLYGLLNQQSNASGSLEFTLQTRDAEAFFPIQIQFVSSELFANIAVAGVTTIDADAPVQYGITSSLATENYICC
jgi:coatomer subunit delta